ncbi:ATP-dependent DNA helicase RecG [Actinomyces sp. MRS3W]|uniref:ATP-dependent DNA helicase RecG n=1 Tax=Actinomyces sp. MRS3W TaxID=2800796 RepID=UPI0028FD5FB9|nr:ATP-dependent DNA helicase RecG [Actinomyces sp. MRS3W]MDU0347235.1 ATP-dependent DNA helicase RecG [Actinomyces sp. MRS3W]
MTPTRSSRRGTVPLLDRPLSRFLTKTTAAHLAKQGVTTVRGLLRLFPRRYDTWGDLTDLRTLVDGEQATIQAQVVRSAARRTRSGRPPALLEATVTDGTASMDVVLFGNVGLVHHYAEQLAPGTTVLLHGKVSTRRGRRQLAGPRFQVLDDLDDAEREALLARPLPIYPATEAMPSWVVAKAVRKVLGEVTAADVPDPLPQEVRRADRLIDAYTAYRWIHTPEETSQWRDARRRLRHEEAFVLQAALVQRRVQHAAEHTAVAWPLPGEDSLLADLDSALPYTLTAGQVRVGSQLADALNSTVPMQVLLQGDVGAGKTLVALRAMLQVVGAGGQAALLAPTEVLATQHRASLEALLGPLARSGMLDGAERATRVRLLTGSTPAAERRQLLADLAGGEPAIVVGTHALLSQTVQIPFLGLVVVDEQHRFGVAQRDALRERGGVTDPATGAQRTPHLLVMTATPIPRTIAMTIFGDLDTAMLDELPAGRRPITTHLVPWERETWVAGIWNRAAKEIAAGGRVYVVCPRIDATENAPENASDARAAHAGGMQPDPDVPDALLDESGDLLEESQEAPDRPLAAVNEWTERLAAEPALAGAGIGSLTGRMTGAEKDAAMADFASGRTRVLVSTTVIEVGVDVPEASMMVILDADRFGLSQLHQLRGRVGRGERESVCIAVTGVEVGTTAYHRLRAFADTNDGFALAEADLELRSEGNVLGAAQSGRRSDLDLLRVTRDGALIAQARAQAEALIAADPTLAEHRALAAAIADRLDEESEAYLERS